MIRIQQLKLDIGHTPEMLRQAVADALKLPPGQIKNYHIVRRSIDARKKPDIFYVYAVDVEIPKEQQFLKKRNSKNLTLVKKQRYQFPASGEQPLATRPVIIGSGPAGLFCALLLAGHGYQPLVLERGAGMEERKTAVERFWRTGVLDTESNVQFGEGGAGTFSDGKLNTLVKDHAGRSRKVLEIFTEAGASPDILIEHKPHIGTDVLESVVKNIRQEIIRLGGEIRFHSKVTDLEIRDHRICSVTVNGTGRIPAELVVLAIGHSARDTFARLKELAVPMQPKPFAVGIRVEHPQNMIDLAQYGVQASGKLPAADYKVTASTSTGRSVYSFCMCPGGYVVNAGSEPGAVAVNGMSYQARGGRNANSAIVVTVTPEDFGSTDILGGVEFQRRLERAAFMAGEGRVPVQLLKDFQDAEPSRNLGDIAPSIKGEWKLSDLRGVLPEVLSRSILEAMPLFDNKIPGFARPDSILSGVESRTSSPVRILRNPAYESEIQGLYPCGEGAGYAGGITSAAMDGMKTAEAIAQRYKPLA
ncbi:NAD(P)/FAD-dependent oxidoreductase [Diplocloster agilis]|uniref:NAD(P)/FAD-dependent oxidoreductase n=1 Tax=Diplocloster agilis TaxID=2850323 RepID=UPI000821F3A0|nr:MULTISPECIES: NAD(P)-binding protein [Lachnospiraceae]MBU9743384.1 FAD-dependent oxidoreductase [Diplocloster agilis]MCU6733928.1 FAD-dependent oxidoreductase [Suonthocola fibrivorans]SCJ15584.1 Uncharacterized conserved protein [uncultured Clostridium sp.]